MIAHSSAGMGCYRGSRLASESHVDTQQPLTLRRKSQRAHIEYTCDQPIDALVDSAGTINLMVMVPAFSTSVSPDVIFDLATVTST